MTVRRGAACCALTDVGVRCTHHNNLDAVLVQRPSYYDSSSGRSMLRPYGLAADVWLIGLARTLYEWSATLIVISAEGGARGGLGPSRKPHPSEPMW